MQPKAAVDRDLPWQRFFEECIVRFTTDIPYLGNWGKPLLLGPGSILDAHTDHERVSKKELSQAVDLYVRLTEQLLKIRKIESENAEAGRNTAR